MAIKQGQFNLNLNDQKKEREAWRELGANLCLNNEVKAQWARCECPTLKKIFPKINKQGGGVGMRNVVEILRKINNKPGAGMYALTL